MEWIALASLIGNVIVPPVYNLIKGWISGGKPDTPEQTMSNLATTKPEVLGQYITGLSSWLDAQTKYFNRDVTGTPSLWVINLRACIRPIVTIASVVVLVAPFFGVIIDNWTKVTASGIFGNWLGTKIEIHP